MLTIAFNFLKEIISDSTWVFFLLLDYELDDIVLETNLALALYLQIKFYQNTHVCTFVCILSVAAFVLGQQLDRFGNFLSIQSLNS